ncbi:MAG: SDR family oxidoreductase [Microvirga sp.]
MALSFIQGATVAFTRPLARKVVGLGIHVNRVAPGPIRTPLIPAGLDAETVASFGGDTPMTGPGQPSEVVSGHLFPACAEASCITGSAPHPNGGDPTRSRNDEGAPCRALLR